MRWKRSCASGGATKQMLAKRADGFGNGMMLALMVETYALLSLIVSVFLVLFA